MPTIEERLNDLGNIDQLARGNSAVHRIDARAKIVITLMFIIAVTSYGRYAVVELVPFAAFPILVAAAADIPGRVVFSRLLLASPFALFIGAANPIIDRAPVLIGTSVHIAAGWISFLSILVRVALCVSAAIVLVATTGFPRLVNALKRLGVPSVLSMQLLLLYRYLFLLIEEALRLNRAHSLRSFGRRALRVRTAGSMFASLLARTLLRARRIHDAMLARGMRGTLPMLGASRFRPVDAVVLVAGGAIILLMRRYDVTMLLGGLLLGTTR